MSNFAALIATIQANIKTNGNEEITGAVLQDILEAMVQVLGTEAINNLETALGNEETARQNADGTLQDNIDAEALRAGTAEAGLDGRLDTIEGEIPSAASSSNKLTDKAYVDAADTALANAIDAIEDAIENGYVYAGIATPSGTPMTGKVFYLALTAGTYTNFGGLTVTQGINILKFNGTAWSQEQLIGIDDEPTAGSENLVKSGGVFQEHLDRFFIGGKIIDNDGKSFRDLPQFPKFGYSTYLRAVPCTINNCYIFGSVSSKKYCWFYDEHLDVVGYLDDTSIDDGEKQLVLNTGNTGNIPPNAKYFRCNINLTKLSTVEGLQSPADFDFPDNAAYKSVLPYLDKPNAYITSNGIRIGSVQGGWGNSITKYCAFVTDFRIQAYAHPAVDVELKYLWFYDEYFNCVGDLAAQSVGEVDITVTSAMIPNKAKYIRFNIGGSILYCGSGKFANITPVAHNPEEIVDNQLINDIFVGYGDLDNDGISVLPLDTYPNFGHTIFLDAVPCAIVDAYIFGNVSTKRYCWFYDEDLNVIGSLADTAIVDGYKTLVLTTDNIPQGARYFRCNINKSKNILILGVKIADIPTFNPPVIYGRTEPSSTQYLRINNEIYPEGFTSGDRLTIDGGTSSPLVVVEETAGTRSVSKQLRNEKSQLKNVLITKKLTNMSSLPSTKIRVLCIGESTTEATVRNPYTGEFDGCWGWPSSMQKINMMDLKDGISTEIITLGRRGNQGAQFTYKNELFTNNSFHEGFSGWPSYTMLNWPCPAKLGNYTDQFSQSTLWYALGLYTKTPYNASSYNVDTEDWTGSDAQITLITSTKLGTYKVDGSSALWNRVKSLSGSTVFGGTYPVFSGTGEYTGSDAQKALLQSWFEELMANPINPFYDTDRARNSNHKTAFNLSKYLERYRTCDDLGVTLVGSAGQTVTGSDGNTYTIGTKVTNTSAYKVCTPSHIVLNIGINDSEGNNTPSNTIENIKDFMSLFSVPVAYFITRMPGVCNPGLWSDNVLCRLYPALSFVTIHNIAVLKALQKWASTHSNKYILAAYHIQYPASVLNEYKCNSIGYPTERINANRNNVHPGYWGYNSVGLQVLHWLYNIIN